MAVVDLNPEHWPSGAENHLDYDIPLEHVLAEWCRAVDIPVDGLKLVEACAHSPFLAHSQRALFHVYALKAKASCSSK